MSELSLYIILYMMYIQKLYVMLSVSICTARSEQIMHVSMLKISLKCWIVFFLFSSRTISRYMIYDDNSFKYQFNCVSYLIIIFNNFYSLLLHKDKPSENLKKCLTCYFRMYISVSVCIILFLPVWVKLSLIGFTKSSNYLYAK